MRESKPSKKKKRCSYDKELRVVAKTQGKGLITISVQMPNGDTYECQTAGSASECRFAKWAGVMLTEHGARPLPDLEEVVRTHVEANHEAI